MLYVTHDQAEAMAIADRVAMLEGGRLLQVASPAVLYREPATPVVARFVGRGTVVPGRVLGPATDGRARVALLGTIAHVRARPGHPAGPAFVCLRSEDVRPAAPGAGTVPAIVQRRAYQGGQWALEVTPIEGPPGTRLLLAVASEAPPAPGQALDLTIQDGWVLPTA